MPKPILNDKEHFKTITNLMKETDDHIQKLWKELEEEDKG